MTTIVIRFQGAVKRQMSYRERQAQLTKERVALAARKLFRERGYVATSIESVAKAAGVAVPTVYSAFGNKKAILEEVRRLWIQQAEVRELLAEALDEPDCRRRLDLAARWHSQQLERGHDVIKIFQEAARADPSIRKVWSGMLQGRAREKQKFTQAIADCLKSGLSVRKATDIYVALETLEIYEELVIERGWTPADYQSWLAKTLREQLLARP
jgi:AcrR family transcriptional regulator